MVRYLTLLAVLLVVTSAPAQGKLEQAREATYAPPRSASSDGGKSKDDDKPSSKSSDSSSDDGELGGLAFVLAGYAVTAPFWGPYLLLEGNGEIKPTAYFPGHPYALPNSDFLDLRENGLKDEPPRSFFDPERLKLWSVRANVEDGHDFNSINRLGARLQLDTTSRFGIATNWDWYQEKLPGGRLDDLVLGDTELTFRFAQSEWLQMHAGLGGRCLLDRCHRRGGFNFLYSAELYPVRPLAVTASAELGNLNHAFTMRLRSTVGVQMQNVEAYVGYDWVNIGGVDLHGPMAGLRLSF
jgi:hypothetical protein